MTKSLFEDELISGMEQQLRKQASVEKPNLAKAAECLHAALEIFEEHGMSARADQVLQLLQKIATHKKELSQAGEFPVGLDDLIRAGLTNRDIMEAVRGNPIATAKFNLIARKLGLSDRHIGQYIGLPNVMSPETAEEILRRNTLPAKVEWESQKTQPTVKEEPGEFLSFKSLAQRKPGRPDRISDRHTKGLTSEKMVKNLETHGHPLNLADDGSFDVPPPLDMNNIKESDFEPEFSEFAELLSNDADDLFAMDINDALEVSENDIPFDDFEEEID